MNKDIVLFTNDNQEIVTLEHLFKKIYNNSETKSKHILDTAEGLKPLIVTLSDAVTLMPTMVQLQEASIRNDEQLIKLAAIVQRMQAKKSGKFNDDGMTFGLSQSEKDEILKAAKESSVPGQANGDF